MNQTLTTPLIILIIIAIALGTFILGMQAVNKSTYRAEKAVIKELNRKVNYLEEMCITEVRYCQDKCSEDFVIDYDVYACQKKCELK